MAGCCEVGDEISDFVKCGEFVYLIRDCWIRTVSRLVIWLLSWFVSQSCCQLSGFVMQLKVKVTFPFVCLSMATLKGEQPVKVTSHFYEEKQTKNVCVRSDFI